MSRTVGGAFEAGGNNFDAIRLIAAIAVLFSHCYPLTGQGADPVLWLTAGQTDAGGAAVGAFFAISGFLVTRSVLTRKPGRYVQARLLRILPALAVVTLIQTFVIGLAFTTLSWRDYLTDPGTFAGLRNAAVFDVRNTLPGVFETNPYPAVVNGSMWTLPVECAFYLGLPFCAMLGALRRRVVVGGGVIVFAALFPGADWWGLSYGAPGPFLLWSVPLYPALSCLAFFMVGSAVWVHRDEVTLSGGLALCCLIALFASAHTISAGFVFHLTWPYLVIYAGLARPCTERPMRRLGDISYGAYLYSFPIQQAVIAWHARPIGPAHLAAEATPLVLCCAILSCHLVERPALLLKSPQRRAIMPRAKASLWPMP